MNRTENKIASPYLPVVSLIEEAYMVSQKEIFLRLTPESPELLNYAPGQFFMAGLPGYGEAPFSITSAPGEESSFEFCIRAVGSLTNKIHTLGRGDRLWVRGPFGRGFDIDEMRGKDILFIAGGIGVVPMRSLVKTILNSSGFGRLTLIYGAKGPEELLFMKEMEEWKVAGLDLGLTIDKPDPAWQGYTGVVTTLIPELELDPGKTISVIIGPPVMYKFVIMSLMKKGIGPENILMSLERRMKCGLGKCGHCQINSVYVCQEGPVFRLGELKGLPEAI